MNLLNKIQLKTSICKKIIKILTSFRITRLNHKNNKYEIMEQHLNILIRIIVGNALWKMLNIFRVNAKNEIENNIQGISALKIN